MPPVVTMTAARRELELADRITIGRDTSGRIVGREHRASHPGHHAVRDDQRVDLVAVMEADEPGLRRGDSAYCTNGPTTPVPVPQGT